MNPSIKCAPLALLALVAALSSFAIIGCGGNDKGGGTGSGGTGSGGGSEGSGGGDTSTSSSKYSCKINGDCMKCPSADDVTKCGTGKAHECKSTEASYCN